MRCICYLDILGCVFPFTYRNDTYSMCIPISQNRSTYCCQNSNCDLNPQWQLCNTTSKSIYIFYSNINNSFHHRFIYLY